MRNKNYAGMLASIIALLIIPMSSLGVQGVTQPVRTIVVTGSADTQVQPDAFQMSFGFEQRGADLAQIKKQTDAKIAETINLLQAQGVAENNIRSMEITVYPWTENRSNERTRLGFIYRRSVFFNHEDIDAFDTIIDKVSALEPSQIGQLTLINTDLEKVKRNLIKLALADARDKASEMAATMGMELGQVVFMSDGTQAPAHLSGNQEMFVARSASASSLPGENTISAEVEVVFELFTLTHNKP